MAGQNSYGWDFDRPTADTLGTFTTFSVGIFQWLTKSSGKGLKKSKGMSHVFGYTAEPERVYDKATEICAKLNREGATVEARPRWLQKQYSISRPAGMVIARLSDDFTAAEVRSMRLKVMKERLLASGFVVGKDATYVRRHGNQIHLINFQGSAYGHKFTVNLAFHYAFIPPLFHMRRLPLANLHLLDCIVWERIGRFLPAKRDAWFDYGSDRDRLIANLQLCATTCLNVFQDCATRWSTPSNLLNDVSSSKRSSWDVRDDLVLAWIELKVGLISEAQKRFAEWRDDDNQPPPRRQAVLKASIEEHLALHGSAQHIRWKDWISGNGWKKPEEKADTEAADEVWIVISVAKRS